MSVTWEDIYMQIAEIVSQKSTCKRRKVGAVLVKDKHLIAVGCNSTTECADMCIRDTLNIPSGEQLELCNSTHAEVNLIATAAALGQSTSGAEVYVTVLPCSMCAKILIGAGISKVVYKHPYSESDQLAKNLFTKAGILVEQYKK